MANVWLVMGCIDLASHYPVRCRAVAIALIVPPGDFLRAILENNEAFSRADEDNFNSMSEIVRLLLRIILYKKGIESDTT